MRWQSTDWEKLFAEDISDKGLLSKTDKESLKCNNKKQPNRKMGQRSEQIPHQRYVDGKLPKNCSTSYVIRKLQIKTTMTYTTYLSNGQKIQIQMLMRIWNNRNLHSLLVGMPNSTATLEGILAVSYNSYYMVQWSSSLIPTQVSWKHIRTKTCIKMFIAALLIIAKTQKQWICPSVGKWINQQWHTQTMEYYSAVKPWKALNEL